MLKNFKDKKILILGFGREGQDTLKFLKKLFPENEIGIADRNENIRRRTINGKNIRWYLGKNYLKALNHYDIIIKSPGIPFKILSSNVLDKITSQTEIFFENCPGKIIGIAGTKGKSTTAAFIYQLLRARRIKAHLVGNIGKPVLSLLLNAKPNHIYVYELSSFQLMNLKKSPHIAILLNAYPDHLDYHKNFNEYVQANANITRYQTKKDFLIYNSQDKLIKNIAKKSRAKKIPIRGKYYNLNIAATKAVAKLFKIPMIKKLKFLSHRLELVGKFKEIEFYNDSLSTIPETTIEALDFLGSNVQTLILGGFDRGLNFKKLAKRILKSNIKTLILFPTTGKQILREIRTTKTEREQFSSYLVNEMEEAVRLAYKYTDRGKICLLSPASPSFGIFKDYAERGDLFKKWVKKYGKN